MPIKRTRIVATATGTNGSASGNAQTLHAINGEIVGVLFKREGTVANTTDVTLKEYGVDEPRTILSVSNINADGWYAPTAPVHDTSGAVVADGPRTTFFVNSKLSLELAESNNNNVVSATILYKDLSGE
jgi:hypothetical protein